MRGRVFVSDPWREIDELERDPVAQDAAIQAALECQEGLERYGTVVERVRAGVVEPPEWARAAILGGDVVEPRPASRA